MPSSSLPGIMTELGLTHQLTREEYAQLPDRLTRLPRELQIMIERGVIQRPVLLYLQFWNDGSLGLDPVDRRHYYEQPPVNQLWCALMNPKSALSVLFSHDPNLRYLWSQVRDNGPFYRAWDHLQVNNDLHFLENYHYRARDILWYQWGGRSDPQRSYRDEERRLWDNIMVRLSEVYYCTRRAGNNPRMTLRALHPSL